MLTSKQRAYLRGLASVQETIMQIGKGGISENLIRTASDATGAEVVTVIGNKIVLYRESKTNKRIEL